MCREQAALALLVEARHMSRLNLKSLGIVLIVIVILLVAIAASWSYHSVPAP